MPHEACRLVLEITSVRVERLQAISEADVLSEGADANGLPDIRLPRTHPRADLPMAYADCCEVFADLWDATRGHWDSNPWVWGIEFKRVEVPGGSPAEGRSARPSGSRPRVGPALRGGPDARTERRRAAVGSEPGWR